MPKPNKIRKELKKLDKKYPKNHPASKFINIVKSERGPELKKDYHKITKRDEKGKWKI